jgi:hypothetical protein
MRQDVDFDGDGHISKREFGEHYFGYMDKREKSMKIKNAGLLCHHRLFLSSLPLSLLDRLMTDHLLHPQMCLCR